MQVKNKGTEPHPEHARAMLPDRCGSKYEKASQGLLLLLSTPLHAKSPCFDLQNMGFIDGLNRLSVRIADYLLSFIGNCVKRKNVIN